MDLLTILLYCSESLQQSSHLHPVVRRVFLAAVKLLDRFAKLHHRAPAAQVLIVLVTGTAAVGIYPEYPVVFHPAVRLLFSNVQCP